MIKRTTKLFVNNFLKKENLKVLDVGCGYSPNEHANVIADVQDLSTFYQERDFVQILGNELPFKDKEFDFVVTSHVIEHVDNPELFIKEIVRVGKSGYIEVPTKLEDNLVFENKKAHLWHLEFDDIDQQLIIKKKIQVFEPILTVSAINKFRKYFSDSLIIQLLWKDKIDFKIIPDNENKIEKISNLNLIRKFISKKIRSIYSK